MSSKPSKAQLDLLRLIRRTGQPLVYCDYRKVARVGNARVSVGVANSLRADKLVRKVKHLRYNISPKGEKALA